MNLIPIKINIEEYPEKIRKYLSDAMIFDSSCHSDAKVIFSDKGFYVKSAESGSLSVEYKMAEIFYKAGLGVKVMDYLSEEKDFFVTESADGKDLTHFTEDEEFVLDIMIKAAKELHGKEIQNIGFSHAYSYYTGFTAPDKEAVITEFTEFLGIHSTENAFDTIKKQTGIFKCDTLIHGDMCLPNVIVNDKKDITFIDVALSGMGDKHMDIYWAMWSLWFNLKSTVYAERFSALYGKENINYDALKLIAAIESLS